jgi:flagellar basal body P-ring formation chaperone FlgA
MNCGCPSRKLMSCTPRQIREGGLSSADSPRTEPIACLAAFDRYCALSGWVLVLSALLHFVAIATAAPPSNDRAMTLLQTAVIREIEAHLFSLGIEAKYWPSMNQLEVLAAPIETRADLSVQDLYWDNLQRTLYFRMACTSHLACTPFLVRANVPTETADLLRQAVRPDREPVKSSSPTPKTNRCRQSNLLVRAGRPATLLLRRENMKITMPVMALECGIAGQQVRARGKKTNKLFEARVVDENLLAATF